MVVGCADDTRTLRLGYPGVSKPVTVRIRGLHKLTSGPGLRFWLC